MRPFLALASLLLVTAATSAAAQTTYARGRDTLRFREVTHGNIQLSGPMGDLALTNEHAAIVAVVRLPGDSAHAWYDSLVIGLSGPMGNQRPATDAALHVPFVLKLDPRGRARLISVPEFPKSFQGVTDLSHQFNDFFLRLPAQPLTVGLAWTDTATRTDSTAEKVVKWRALGAYHVDRDTVVGGMPAVVVSVKQVLQLDSDGPVPDPPMRATALLSGTEEGYVIFAPRAGKLVSRRRTGRIEGDVSMAGGGNTMSMRQTYSYVSSLDALP